MAALTPRNAAVLAVDVVGYSRLMGVDQQATVADLEAVRAILKTHTEAHGGRVADVAGDAVIAVFDTAVGAAYAAAVAQGEVADRAAGRPEDRRMLLRMGIHVGEILEEPDGSVYGEAVNIAARLESLAPTGGVTVSQDVRASVNGQSGFEFLDQGEYDFKNIARPVRVYLVAQEGGPASLAPSRKASQRIVNGNLPVMSTNLVGVADALEQVRELLETARLVTLFGTGGIGKTRLSIETARRVGPEFPDGAWFVDLAAVDDAAAVGHAVAGVFNVTQQSGKSIEQALVDALRSQRLVLVLDNCEHVTAAAARLADALLTACPHVKIIATSRETLSIDGEQVWPVSPLETGGSSTPAVQLFVDRARSVLPDFRAENCGDDIAEICRALDGIPLAIELAAARVRSLPPRQILTRLNQRFRLLTGGSRAARERHQTLLHAVQWSYDLLSETEKTVLARATVFAGGFTLEAAERVCEGGEVDAFDVYDVLDSLVRKSLLTVTRTDEGVRYGMLETIRAFGAEALADTAEARPCRQAHARFYAAEADENFALWRSPRQREAHEWLDLEINNLRNAFRWALDNGDVDVGARIASSVGDMGRFRLREEAANWAEEIVEQARSARHPRLIILLTWSASSAWAFLRFDDARRFGEQAIALLDDAAFEPFVWAYGDLAFVSIYGGDIDGAIELLRTGAAHPADERDRFMLAFLLFIMATAGRADEALRIADDVVRKVDAAGVPMSIAVAYGGKGAALEATDEAASLAAYERGVEVARQSGARFMETLLAPRLAALHARSGDPVAALQGFERMLASFGEATDIASVSAWRTALIALLSRLGHFQAAATLHGTMAESIEGSGVVPEHADAVQRVRDALGERTFATTTARGATMSLQEAANYASVQVHLALATLEQPIAV